MRSPRFARAVLHIGLVVVSSITSLAQESRPITKTPSPGARIVDRIKPGESVVTLTAPGRIDFAETFPLTAEQELDRIAAWPDVAVFTVKDSTSFLVRNDTWVRTRVTGLINTALRRSPNASWGNQADSLTLEFENGEVIVNGVTVRAGRYPVFQRGGRYLAELTFDSEERSWGLNSAYEIAPDGMLAPVRNWDGTAARVAGGTLTGLSLETILRRFQRQ